MKKMKILLEGNIGCGKTFFVNNFLKFLDEKKKSNPVTIHDSSYNYFVTEKSDYIKLMREDPKNWSFPVQLLFMKNFIERYEKDSSKFTIFTRSIISVFHVFNFLYMDYFNENEKQILQNLYNKHENQDYDLVIYFTCSVNTLMERNKNKNNTNNNLKKEELELLQKRYEMLKEDILQKKFKNKLLVIDTDKDNKILFEELFEIFSKKLMCL